MLSFKLCSSCKIWIIQHSVQSITSPTVHWYPHSYCSMLTLWFVMNSLITIHQGPGIKDCVTVGWERIHEHLQYTGRGACSDVDICTNCKPNPGCRHLFGKCFTSISIWGRLVLCMKVFHLLFVQYFFNHVCFHRFSHYYSISGFLPCLMINLCTRIAVIARAVTMYHVPPWQQSRKQNCD